MVDNLLYDLLKRHVGHNVVISDYGDGANMSLECEDCGCVIFDTDLYDLCSADDMRSWISQRITKGEMNDGD